MRLIVLLLSLMLFYVDDAAPGRILQSEYVTTHSVETIKAFADRFYPPEQVLAPQYAVDEYRVVLSSLYREDEPIEIVAQLYVPRLESEARVPVFVLGAGSTGIDDKCAPSLEQPEVQNWGSYRGFLLSVATHGYITMLPDYAGFNDPDRIQPYYVAEMAGRVVLDASRAVYDFFSEDAEWAQPDTTAQPADAVFLSGYSQGGQTIFAAKDIWTDYAPDVPLAGVVGYAPVVNMQSHMLTLPIAAPYRIMAYTDYYQTDALDLGTIFLDRWVETMPQDTIEMCIFDAAGYYSMNANEMYQPDFLTALTEGTLADTYPDVNALFELNNPGFVQNDVPALIIQGTQDRTIPMPLHEQFVEKYCAAGNQYTEFLYQDVTHFRVREVSYREVLDWMASVAAGETPRNDCASE